MLRELIAALLIAALIAVALLNIQHIDRLTDDLTVQLEQAKNEAERGELKTALKRVEHCMAVWTKASNYAYASMRHEETVAVFEGFYDLMEVLAGGERDAAAVDFERLIYRLRVIHVREHISIASIM